MNAVRFPAEKLLTLFYIKIRDFNREVTKHPGRLWNVSDSKTGQ